MPVALGARWAGGLMNSDPAVNPTTADWNKVWVQYCDGSSQVRGSCKEWWLQGENNFVGHICVPHCRG